MDHVFEVTAAEDAHDSLLIIVAYTAVGKTVMGVLKVDPLLPDCKLPLTYHAYTGVDPPLDGLAVKFTVAPLQTALALPVMAMAGCTLRLIVAVTGFELTGLGVTQAKLLVMVQVAVSEDVTVVLYETELFPACGAPLIYHWKDAAESETDGVAVKVTDEPGQTAESVTVKSRLMEMVLAVTVQTLELTMVGLAHGASLVKEQRISELLLMVVVKNGEFPA